MRPCADTERMRQSRHFGIFPDGARFIVSNAERRIERRRAVPEKPNAEFWRNLKPIEKVFQPDALPEVYIQNAPTEDERYYVPFSETVYSRPIWISPQQNKWCDILMAKGAGLVNRHYHPHEVF